MEKHQKFQVVCKKRQVKDKNVEINPQEFVAGKKSLGYEYALIILALENRKLEKEAEMLPYRIPAMYSLEYEETMLDTIKSRMGVVHKAVRKTDIESIASDWKQVGRELNGAIRECKRRYAEKNG